jgi:type IV fimbrial biogenesis protein FimT
MGAMMGAMSGTVRRATAGARHRQRGFTLIELMITISIATLLLLLGLPTLSTWIQNTKTRTVAENLANGLRLAEVEAARRAHSVNFILTNDAPSYTATPVANGKFWSMSGVAQLTSDTPATLFIQGAQLSGATAGVTVTGPASLLFNSVGRLSNPGGAVAAVTFNVQNTQGDRPLNVTVAPSGQVRLCDPAFTLSNTTPTGC